MEPICEKNEEKYLAVSSIQKELTELEIKHENVLGKIKSLNEELAKLKETALVLTGAKMAFSKIVNATPPVQEDDNTD